MDMGDMMDGLALVFVAPFLLAAIGLIVGGATFILTSWRCLPRYPSCGRCGYDLSGSLGRTTLCPECGSPFALGGIRPAGTGRLPSHFVAGATMLALGLLIMLFWGVPFLADF
jgi:hypothetical protein